MVKNGKSKRKYHKPTKPHHQSSPSAADENKPITVKTLPAHLLLEILYRTPVKSLVRFNCVSKSWFALINHPTFIKMHLDFNTSRNDKEKQLICSCGYSLTQSRRKIALLSFSQDPVLVHDIDKHHTERPNYPRKINFRDFSKKMVLAGSINGIVCLSHSEEMSGRFVALWNPGINHWNPIPLVETKSWDYMSVGLGFDAVTSDYKVICIVPENLHKNYGWSRVEIYSTNQGSWENVDGNGIFRFWAHPELKHCNFIVKGVPYWMGFNVQSKNEVSGVLGRIDPLTGFYKEVNYPRHVMNKNSVVSPVKWRDSVAVLIESPGECPNQMVDLYVLDENTTNWTKMYSIGPLIFEREHLRIPQCFTTGEILIQAWTGNIRAVRDIVRCICDPRTNLVHRKPELDKLYPYWYGSYSHVESLVCLKGMVQIGKEHKDKKTNPKMKNWTEFLCEDFEMVLHLR